jgi:outer membrane protein OmpA-like peptidoglycan-associated protein
MKKISMLIVFVAVFSFILTSVVFDRVTPAMAAQQANQGASPQSLRLAPGQKQKIKGVIIKRMDDHFTLRDQWGSELTVRLNTTTKLPKKYTSAQLIRSLPVEVKGRGDNEGALTAEQIKFSDKDLMMARAVESQVVPVEERLNVTENRLSQTEQNAQRLSGQIEEMTEVANLAQGGARAAQETADAAISRVNWTNERIAALDNYEAKQILTVNFKVGSANLSPEALTRLDELATQAKAEKGFAIEVTGFASSDGSPDFNRRLSERRANTVVRYLVESHGIPLRHITMPFGFGETLPVADNGTREGRQQNRRVEVRLLVSRGMTMSAAEAPAHNITAAGSPIR